MGFLFNVSHVKISQTLGAIWNVSHVKIPLMFSLKMAPKSWWDFSMANIINESEKLVS
jgi:hypothetical protein